jgi:hypothetical protein
MGRRRSDRGDACGLELRGTESRQCVAAVVLTSSRWSAKLGIVRAVSVHRLAHAAGVWRRGGDRQSYGGEGAHEHQGQQQPGG